MADGGGAGRRRRCAPVLLWSIALLTAAVLGAGSARTVVEALVRRDAVRVGPWTTLPDTGNRDADPYTRAAVAIAGLYALSRDEAIYFTAFEDDDGRALDGRCSYTVRGVDPAARWWSVTLYGADHFLVANPAAIYSRHARNVRRDDAGAFAIAVSAQRPAADVDWLPAPAAAPFSLTLRLYRPGPALQRDPAAAVLPRIERGDCR